MRKFYTKSPAYIRIALLVFSSFLCSVIFAQAPAIQWTKCYGGSNVDVTQSIQTTTDGGYIVAGLSLSNDGDANGNHGGVDFWIVKLTNTGQVTWQKSFGGTRQDRAYSIQQTSDGGYIIAGATNSQDGDVTGWHQGQQNAAFSSDFWVIKLSSAGNLQWQKCYGGSLDDVAYSIHQTSDGGYVIAGSTCSNDGDVTGYHTNTILPGSSDFWVIKISSNGNLQWQRCYGAVWYEVAYSIQQTSDGGYIVGGYTNSYDGGDVQGSHNPTSGALWGDFWVIKISATGILQWQKCLGGSEEDICYSVKQTNEGGYIAVGYANSNNGNVSGIHGSLSSDCWVVKLNSTGGIDWQKCYGGTKPDEGKCIQQTSDGGYIIAGNALSNDGDLRVNNGNLDFWLLKITSGGIIEWQKSLGGSQNETAWDIKPTSDGGYITAGLTASNDGDVSGYHGNTDFWVVKLGAPLCVGSLVINTTQANICSGTPVTFTSTITNGGTFPVYQWKVNNNNVGTNSSTFTTSSLKNNDSIVCIVASDASCLANPVIISNTIIIKVDSCLPKDDSCITTYFKLLRSNSYSYIFDDFYLMRNNKQLTPTRRYEQLANGTIDVTWGLNLFDEKGNFIKGVNVFLNNISTGFSSRKMTDNTIMLISYSTNSTNGIPRYTFTLVSDNLDIIWSKTAETYANYEFNNGGNGFADLHRDEEGNYYFVATSLGFSFPPGVLAYKMDKNGNQLWLKAYNLEKGLFGTASAVTTASSLIMIVEGDSKGSVTARFDKATGQLLNSYIYQNNFAGAIYKRLAVYDKGRIYYGGNTGSEKFLMGTFDTTGRPLKLRSINNSATIRSGAVKNGMLFANYSYFDGFTFKDVLLKADSNLDIQFYREYGSMYKISRGMGVGDNGYVYTAGIYSTGPQNSLLYPYITKFSEKGELGTCSYSAVVPSITDINPNPVVLSFTPITRSFQAVSVPISFIPDNDGPKVDAILCSSSVNCNSIKLSGTNPVCSLNTNYLFTIKKNIGCDVVPNLSIDTSYVTIASSTDSTLIILFKKTGNTVIKVKLNSGCKVYEDSLLINIQNSPAALNLGPDTVLCTGNTILLNARTGFATYKWQDGSTDSTFTVTAPGTYFVKTTNGCGGVFYDTVIVSSHPPIPFDIGPDLTKCNSDTLTVTAPTGFINYIWTPAYNINSTTSQTVKLYPSVDTIYKVKAEKTPGCFAYDSLRVKVYSSPKINLGLDRNFCLGDSIVLNAGTGFSQYLWSSGNISQQIVVKNAGTYFVTATTTNNCTSKDTITILSVYPNPVVKLDHDSTLCIGSARILNAGNFVSYLWNTGNTSQLLSINTIGMYSVTVTDNNNCKGTDSVKIVTILPSPFNFLPGDTSVCSYGTLQLSSKAAFSKYLWNTNAVTSSINITQPGIYWLQVKDFNNCTGKDSIIVAQKDCLKGFFIPNAFSPNNDGKNDIYRPMLFGKVMQYEFAIYNQWGEIVFKSVDVNKGWDGKYKALPQDGNIFIWTCKYQFENEPIKIEKGTVLLLR